MPLSLLQVVGPLYSIHNEYNETYKRFGDNVYLNSLNSSKSTVIEPQNSASPSIVSSLLITMYDRMLEFQNARYMAYKHGESERSTALMYYVPFVISICIIGLAIVAYSVYKIFQDKPEKDVIDK